MGRPYGASGRATMSDKRGLSYRIVQEAAQRAWDEGVEFRELLAESAPDLDLDAVFDPAAFVRHAPAIVGRLDSIR